MTVLQQTTEQKSFDKPDETRSFERGVVELVTIGGAEIGRLVLQPGWRWSEHVKPIAGTELCEAPHFQYHVSGTLGVRMTDGTELVVHAGEVTSLARGPRRVGDRRRAGRDRGLLRRLELRQALTRLQLRSRIHADPSSSRRRVGLDRQRDV